MQNIYHIRLSKILRDNLDGPSRVRGGYVLGTEREDPAGHRGRVRRRRGCRLRRPLGHQVHGPGFAEKSYGHHDAAIDYVDIEASFMELFELYQRQALDPKINRKK